MGQPQFMPSSYLRHGVDFDGDGKADIWTSVADVFGSMANYLKEAGWKAGGGWGREVRISDATMDRIQRSVPNRPSGCRALREMTLARPVGEWRKLGVTLADGKPLPGDDPAVSLVRGKNRHFLVQPNFHGLLGYNCSNAYAVSVGLLADEVKR
jgi:membrane-bound lytic murein transglycosylase B